MTLSPLQETLLSSLEHVRAQSGAVLASRCGVSRTAVWKAMQGLQEKGYPVSHTRTGYRFSFPYQALSLERFTQALSHQGQQEASAEIFPWIDSTNSYLLERARQDAPHGHVVLAEGQTRGRGRRGKSWVSPLGQNLYLSVLLRFRQSAASLAVFSLVAGLVLAETLTGLGLDGHGLKWPNDILWNGKKLAGVLTELQGEIEGPCALVVGYGLNVQMQEAAGKEIDQAWAGLAQTAVSQLDRNEIAALLLTRLFEAYHLFYAEGFEAFRTRWQPYDLLHGKEIRVVTAARTMTGHACGVSSDGHLQLHVKGEMLLMHSGEVSVRL